MNRQSGFSLFELMIAIAVIAILTAIGLPAYQSYIKKAALTDMLQAMTPYKTSVELCAIDLGTLTQCNTGINQIPDSKSTRYVSSINVKSGIISLVGNATLSKLTVTLTPKINNQFGQIDWSRTCKTSPVDAQLNSHCEGLFQF